MKYKIELGVENTTYARFYFPRQTDPIKKQVYEKKIASKNTEYAGFYNITHGIERLQKVFIIYKRSKVYSQHKLYIIVF